MKKCTITLGATALEIHPLPTASTPIELLKKTQINEVYPMAFQKKPVTGYVSHATPSGAMTLGETVTGGTSGATATLAQFVGTGQWYLTNVVGTFVSGETLTGGTSTKTAVISTALIPYSTDNEWQYPYKTMTVLVVKMTNGDKFDVELQNVTNQATWNLGTLAALNQAVADINAWL